MAKRNGLSAKNTVPVKREGKTRGLRIGNPGNKGGGDTTKAYKIRMRALLDSAKHQAELAAALEDRTSPAFLGALTHAARYGYGVPTQTVEVSDLTPQRLETGDQVMDRVVGSLLQVVGVLAAQKDPRTQALLAAVREQAVIDAEFTIEPPE